MTDIFKKLFFKKEEKILNTIVSFDKYQIKVLYPNGNEHNCNFEDINSISFVTTDEGPMLNDLFLVLKEEKSNCIIPSDADGYDEIYERVTQFEGFDFAKTIEAMKLTDNNEFVCWEK